MEHFCMTLEEYRSLPNEKKIESLYIIAVDGIEYVLKEWRNGCIEMRRERTDKLPFSDSFMDFFCCFNHDLPSDVDYIIQIIRQDDYIYMDNSLTVAFTISENTMSFIGYSERQARSKMKEIREMLL